MSRLSQEFAAFFRGEHRQVRDALLDLIESLQDGDGERTRRLLGEIAGLTGPHFRYEEESLYPALTVIFGQPYIDRLFQDHDGAIERAATIAALAAGDDLSEAEVEHAVKLVREILPHVSDCEGLSVMVEVLPEENVESILSARERAQRDGLDLFAWATTIRNRPLAI